jgi:hypothetical protein
MEIKRPTSYEKRRKRGNLSKHVRRCGSLRAIRRAMQAR